MCPVQFRHDGPPGGVAFMDPAAFARLIDQFHSVKELHLQGLGEPMMHPGLFDMIAYAAGRGIRVSVNSNMTLLGARRAALCISSGMAELSISVDSADPATYERIRVGARFARVEQNVHLLMQARRQAVSRSPEVRLVAVLMRQTLDGLPDLVRLARRWSIERLFVQHLCHDFAESSLPAEYQPMREFVDEQSVLGDDIAHIESVFAETRRVAEELAVEVRLPHPRPRPHPPGTSGPARCDWPWKRAYISYQGLAMPCCIVATPDRINFGNMAKRGADAVWNSPSYDEFRSRLASDDPPEICRTCAVYRQMF
jgi:radical SAM protein with 4Fe4S-binding SPASM domain